MDGPVLVDAGSLGAKRFSQAETLVLEVISVIILLQAKLLQYQIISR
jgi:hypothetical protein